jgi:hypothetical protein
MIYHYTKTIHLASILTEGLRPSHVYGPVDKPLWFSANPRWERTVFLDDASQLEDAYLWGKNIGGIARIACDDAIAPYRLQETCQIAGISTKLAKGLIESARRVGANPWEWRATLETVPVEQFRSIEIYDGQTWRPVSLPEAMQISVDVNQRFEIVDGEWVRPKPLSS